MSSIRSFRVIDRSILVGTGKPGETIDLRGGDVITSQGGPFVHRGKVLAISAEVIDRLMAKKRLVAE